MVLDAYRHLADAVLDPIAARFEGMTPDAISWLALICAFGAGAFFFLGGGTYLLLGASFVFLNALFDALDGKVAKRTGRASSRGDFLDHVLDRYADVLMLGGIALGRYCPPWLGLLAIVGVFLTSYMGTQAQAVGAKRDYGGLLGRADRLVILILAVLLQAALDPGATVAIGVGALTLTVLGWAMVLFAVLGNVTAIQRAASTWRHLSGP